MLMAYRKHIEDSSATFVVFHLATYYLKLAQAFLCLRSPDFVTEAVASV